MSGGLENQKAQQTQIVKSKKRYNHKRRFYYPNNEEGLKMIDAKIAALEKKKEGLKHLRTIIEDRIKNPKPQEQKKPIEVEKFEEKKN